MVTVVGELEGEEGSESADAEDGSRGSAYRLISLVLILTLDSSGSHSKRAHAEDGTDDSAEPEDGAEDDTHGKKRHRVGCRSPPPTKGKSRRPQNKPGMKPKHVSKTTAACFEDEEQQLLRIACREFEVRIFTVHGFPTPEVQTVWAQEVWKSANKLRIEAEEPEILYNNGILAVVRFYFHLIHF